MVTLSLHCFHARARIYALTGTTGQSVRLIVSQQPLKKLFSLVYAELCLWDFCKLQRLGGMVLHTISVKLSCSFPLLLAYSASVDAQKRYLQKERSSANIFICYLFIYFKLWPCFPVFFAIILIDPPKTLSTHL